MRTILALILAVSSASALSETAQTPPVSESEEQRLPTELPLRGAQIYSVPPKFEYPVAALRADIDGNCYVSFTIDAAGIPQDIQPNCDNPVFNEPVRVGVAATRLIVGDTRKAGDRFRLPVHFRIPL